MPMPRLIPEDHVAPIREGAQELCRQIHNALGGTVCRACLMDISYTVGGASRDQDFETLEDQLKALHESYKIVTLSDTQAKLVLKKITEVTCDHDNEHCQCAEIKMHHLACEALGIEV